MDQVGLDYQPQEMNIKKDDLVASLLNLKNYVIENSHLWFTIINTEEINNKWIEGITIRLNF